MLIHSAAGGVGQAAIMLAQHVEAKIFVTVGSKLKRDFLVKNYDIPLDSIFSDRDSSFAAKIIDMTNHKGVNVVLTSLAGKLFQETWKCMASFGRFIEIVKRDLEQNTNLEMAPFTRSLSFFSVDWIALGELRGNIVAETLVSVMSLLEKKAIRPVSPITTYSNSELHKAFNLLKTGKHIGKLVVQPHRDELVRVRPASGLVPVLGVNVLLRFSLGEMQRSLANASYLVVSGFGGLGRSVCQWLVEHGAINIILLSRNAQSQANASFLIELRKSGTTVEAYNCNVADKLDLARAMNRCQKMPPVRGLIQGVMVLKVWRSLVKCIDLGTDAYLGLGF